MSAPQQGTLAPTPAGPFEVRGLDAETGVALSLVLPTYNEVRNIEELLRRLTELLQPLRISYELIVVDDDSPDGTWERALALGENYRNLRVIRRIGERGLSSAVIRGWQAATGQVLGVMDADLQHPPGIVPALWRQMERGAQLAAGSRHIEGGGVSEWSLQRRLLSRGAQLIGLMILPEVVGALSDPMSGCFLVRRAAIANIALAPRGYKILLEVMARADIRRVAEVGYVFNERTEGRSKISPGVYWDYLVQLAALRLGTLPIASFARFSAVGLTGAAVDMGLLYLLSDPRSLGLSLTLSKLAAAEVAMLNNFLWNDAWTFRIFVKGQRTLRAKCKRFVKFNFICGLGLIFSLILLNVQTRWLGIDRYIANGIAILAVTLWNFSINRKLNWRVTEVGAGAPSHWPAHATPPGPQ